MLKYLYKNLKRLKNYFFKRTDFKKWVDMSLYEQWQYARDNFQHYTLRYVYDDGDGYRRTVSYKEK